MKDTTIKIWDRTWASSEPTILDLDTRLIFENISKEICLKGKTTLELGCGRGRLSYLAYKAGAKELTLVDFSPEALKIAKGLLQGADKATFVESDILNLNLGKKYDVVFSSGVVEHFNDEELPLAIAAHAMHSARYVVIIVPSETFFNERRCKLPQNIERFGYWRPISAKRMRELFEKTGVQVKQNRRFHVMYGVPPPTTRGARFIQPIRPTAIRGVSNTRKVLTKSLKPLEHWFGGLLLTVGEV
ncbi:MAG: class I SAM-dependent methyltransferase [Dehalococcoidia bacterium]|nr:class I SAM-dependent methyltransferase [Dehalococcoidia bacterium]